MINCSIGAATPGGSLTVVLKAVRVLGPRAVISVGTYISLGLEKAKIGDVVISSRLTTTEGFKTPASPRLGSLSLDAPYGWKAPLKHPDEWEIKVHCNGDILSQSLREKCQNICEQYPEAVRVLGPKAVFSVGTCISLGLEKARIGDVVISSRLITTEGFKTPASPRLGNLALDAPFGWKAPLKHPDGWEIKVHCNGDILSQSLRATCEIVNICERYPEAIAIETEGEGT